jgi:hypothetical protein
MWEPEIISQSIQTEFPCWNVLGHFMSKLNTEVSTYYSDIFQSYTRKNVSKPQNFNSSNQNTCTKMNPEYKFTAWLSHFTDTCQTYPSLKWLAKWTLWICNVHNKIIRCHQWPHIIQVCQNNTWAHFIDMYYSKYPNKIISTEYISRNYIDCNMVLQ